MPRFSANLGFLWAELPLPQAIEQAAQAGFAAVETHWPYDLPPSEVTAALRGTDLPMLGINTVRGDRPGDFGLSAVPGRGTEALAAIDQAIDYAHAIGAKSVHVMAGKAAGPEAERQFRMALTHALTRAQGLTILIEPINQHDAPGYFLRDTAQALDLIAEFDTPNLRLMFDCYHVARSEGDVLTRLQACLPHVGHIQFAAVPDRGAPDHGDLDYGALFAEIDALGWDRPLGAEYKPLAPTADTLAWMEPWV